MKDISSILPNEILITDASGVGNHVVWEFYRGEGIQDVGQYNLEIIFRIPSSMKIEDPIPYYIDWNVKINNRSLIDHPLDLNDPDNDIYEGTNGRKVMTSNGFIRGIPKKIDENLKENNKKKFKLRNNYRSLDKEYYNKYSKFSELKLCRPLQLISPQKEGLSHTNKAHITYNWPISFNQSNIESKSSDTK